MMEMLVTRRKEADSMNSPKIGERYRHFKGRDYEIVAIATHTETEEKLVVYKALYGSFEIYARPLSMFLEKVDREKYPDATQEYRFERIDEQTHQADEEEGEVDADLLAFLNAESFHDKVELLENMQDKLTDALIDSFAAASDLEIKSGPVSDRYEELRNCLLTHARFECDRLR